MIRLTDKQVEQRATGKRRVKNAAAYAKSCLDFNPILFNILDFRGSYFSDRNKVFNLLSNAFKRIESSKVFIVEGNADAIYILNNKPNA